MVGHIVAQGHIGGQAEDDGPGCHYILGLELIETQQVVNRLVFLFIQLTGNLTQLAHGRQFIANVAGA